MYSSSLPTYSSKKKDKKANVKKDMKKNTKSEVIKGGLQGLIGRLQNMNNGRT